MFGLDRKSVASFEEHPPDSPAWMDCFWSGKFMIEMKSHNENLDRAIEQALEYYVQLKKDQEPRYILACDFQTWHLRDKQENTDHIFLLVDLVDNVGLFGFMTDRPKIIVSDPVNFKATKILGDLFDLLKESNYGSHNTEYFLTRLIFCLFADDTGIFGDHGRFQNYLKESTNKDGSDLGSYLAYLFSVLNQPQDERSKTMDPKMRSFPYINGSLFEKQIDFPVFNSAMRQLLVNAGDYDWSKVSPAIFGSMFQTVMDQGARREMGAHYTSEENILKVIRPLFLDELNREFNTINLMGDDSKKDEFIKFQDKLSNLKFLDPACGSGNFLVICYREIRRLELRIIMKIYGYEGKRIDTNELSKIDVDQFYGIELIEFSAKIAETSLWMMDHIMNVELSKRYGVKFRRIPIRKKPNIRYEDALEFDWNRLLSSEQCNYIFGNPPFVGSKMQTVEQRGQIKQISNLKGRGGTLDYVCGWFLKSAQYISKSTKVGFVSTNSITQGEQVGQLWPILSDVGIEINFAYKSFKWDSEAKGKAQVTVTIIGFGKESNHKKRLFHYDEDGKPIEENSKFISPYLIGSDTVLPIVKESHKPLNKLPDLIIGTQPIDGGHYIFTDEQKNKFLNAEPDAKKFFRQFVGSQELINGNPRWILTLQKITLEELKKLPKIKERIEKVQKFRKKSVRKITKKLADSPTEYNITTISDKTFLAIPCVSSENRNYVPIVYFDPSIICSNRTMIIKEASLGLFGLLTSKIHMLWLQFFGGRLETRYNYSASIVYNTFPVPDTSLDVLEPYAQTILDIRNKYPNSTLADLYSPLTMPSDLLKAHQKLDRKVEKLYRDTPFQSDHERAGFLLERYQKMVNKQTTL